MGYSALGLPSSAAQARHTLVSRQRRGAGHGWGGMSECVVPDAIGRGARVDVREGQMAKDAGSTSPVASRLLLLIS